MIEFSAKGDWSQTNKFLERCLNVVKLSSLDKYGRQGVQALADATPKGTGKTADSWYYRVVWLKNGVRLEWLNSSQNEGIPIVILLQYGHLVNNGINFVQGVDFINPAIKPIFEEIADNMWKELTSG